MRLIVKFTSFKYKCGKRTSIRYVLTLVFLLLFSTSLHVAAITSEPRTSTDTLHNNDTVSIFTEKILFPKGSAIVSRDFSGNSVRIDSIFSFLSKTDTPNILNVKVVGSYSPEGNYTFNTNLANVRASALAEIVRKTKPSVNPVTSIRHPSEVEEAYYQPLRAAELEIVYRDNTVNAGVACLYENDMRGNDHDSTAIEANRLETAAPPQTAYHCRNTRHKQ